MANSVDESTTMTLSPSSRHITGGGFAFSGRFRSACFRVSCLVFLLRRYPLIVTSAGSRSLHLVLFLGRGAALSFHPSKAWSYSESFGKRRIEISLAHAPSLGSALWVTGSLRYHSGLPRVLRTIRTKSCFYFHLRSHTHEVHRVLRVEISMGHGGMGVYDVYLCNHKGALYTILLIRRLFDTPIPSTIVPKLLSSPRNVRVS